MLLTMESNSPEGMVHRLRKQANKQDCSVFGMSTDGAVFFCLKINNKSEVSNSGRTVGRLSRSN